jgi:hypothetical protein
VQVRRAGSTCRFDFSRTPFLSAHSLVSGNSVRLKSRSNCRKATRESSMRSIQICSTKVEPFLRVKATRESSMRSIQICSTKVEPFLRVKATRESSMRSIQICSTKVEPFLRVKVTRESSMRSIQICSTKVEPTSRTCKSDQYTLLNGIGWARWLLSTGRYQGLTSPSRNASRVAWARLDTFSLP